MWWDLLLVLSIVRRILIKMLATSAIPNFEGDDGGDDGGECSLDSSEDAVDIMVVG